MPFPGALVRKWTELTKPELEVDWPISVSIINQPPDTLHLFLPFFLLSLSFFSVLFLSPSFPDFFVFISYYFYYFIYFFVLLHDIQFFFHEPSSAMNGTWSTDMVRLGSPIWTAVEAFKILVKLHQVFLGFSWF